MRTIQGKPFRFSFNIQSKNRTSSHIWKRFDSHGIYIYIIKSLSFKKIQVTIYGNGYHNNEDLTMFDYKIITKLNFLRILLLFNYLLGRKASHSTFKIGFLNIFAGRPHCLWCPKSRWSLPLCPSITLKLKKNGLEARKLQPPK